MVMRPLFAISRSSLSLQSTCLQHFSSQDIEAKASRIALCGLNQPVECFRVSIGYAMIEKSKNRVIPVGDSSHQCDGQFVRQCLHRLLHG